MGSGWLFARRLRLFQVLSTSQVNAIDALGFDDLSGAVASPFGSAFHSEPLADAEIDETGSGGLQVDEIARIKDGPVRLTVFGEIDAFHLACYGALGAIAELQTLSAFQTVQMIDGMVAGSVVAVGFNIGGDAVAGFDFGCHLV